MDPLKEMEQAQLRLFKKDDAPEIILNYVRNGCLLLGKAQAKMFELKNADIVVKTYIKHFRLKPSLQRKLFEMKNAEDMIRRYIKHWPLTISLQLKMIQHPKANEFVALYNFHSKLHPKVQRKWYAMQKKKEVS